MLILHGRGARVEGGDKLGHYFNNEGKLIKGSIGRDDEMKSDPKWIWKWKSIGFAMEWMLYRRKMIKNMPKFACKNQEKWNILKWRKPLEEPVWL